MLSVDNIADFEGLLKMMHSSLDDESRLSYLANQLKKQGVIIVERYAVEDKIYVKDLVEGIKLLLNLVSKESKTSVLLSNIVTDFESLKLR